MSTHTFVVPAYGEPAWLDRCLDSLQRQTKKSRVLLATSTPNERLTAVAERYAVPLIVNPVSAGIASDWNFALRLATSQWVTLAHQDDWYAPQYLESCLTAVRPYSDVLLAFTAAFEVKEGADKPQANTWIKRAICGVSFLGQRSLRSSLRRRLLLSFGNPVPCPSVMLNTAAIEGFSFPEGWKSNLDWQAWLNLAARPGRFVYVPTPLVHRTLHADATTTRILTDREREDDRMFKALWPWPVASVLAYLYAPSRRPYGAVNAPP